jgi:hypothetical protein
MTVWLNQQVAAAESPGVRGPAAATPMLIVKLKTSRSVYWLASKRVSGICENEGVNGFSDDEIA